MIVVTGPSRGTARSGHQPIMFVTSDAGRGFSTARGDGIFGLET